MTTLEVQDPLLGVSPEEEARILAQAGRNASMREKFRLRKAEGDSASIEVPLADSHDFMPVSIDTPNQIPWLSSVSDSNAFLAYHTELAAFCRWVGLTPAEEYARREFFARVRDAATSIFPGCYLVIFGSSFTGLALPSSDIDVALMNVDICDDTRVKNSMTTGFALRSLAELLLKQGDVSFVEVRDKARVPLLVLRDKYGANTELDISLNVENPLGTSRFIKENGADKFPGFRPLTIFLKCFLFQRNLHDTYYGGVGSYLLSCLVIAFFQQKNVSDNLSLGHLLFDFFTFYTKEFNSAHYGLSVRNSGEKFDKRDRYFESTGPRRTPVNDSVCIESPLEPHLDIGNKCFQWKIVKQAFIQARLEMIDTIAKWGSEKRTGSLLVPGLIESNHEMLKRFQGLKQPDGDSVYNTSSHKRSLSPEREPPSKRMRRD